MPISPSNRKRYPKHWKEIRSNVQARSGGRCECLGECGISHQWEGDNRCQEEQGAFATWRSDKHVVVILTVSHRDHVPEHNDMDNLRHLCQKCHNRYDAKHRALNRAKTIAAKREYQERRQLKIPLL